MALPERLRLDDSAVHAAAAGLAFVDDSEPGITRRRRGRGFSFHLPDGTLVRGIERDRLVTLAVPPAWREVWLSVHADGHLQATGRDDADRKQYRYHDAFRARREAWKFERLAWFGPALDRLRAVVAEDLHGDDPDRRRLAAAVRLIDRSLIRVGSERAAEAHGTRGATTLTGDDVEVRGSRILLAFTAKGGTEREVEVVDEALADVVRDLLDQHDDHAVDLFDVDVDGDDVADPLRPTHVNTYLGEASGSPFTAKDFRTWGGTVAAAAALLGEAGQARRPDLVAVDAAAEELGNTRSVARASYVAPAVLAAGEDGTLERVHARTRSGARLSRVERTVMRVLREAATD